MRVKVGLICLITVLGASTLVMAQQMGQTTPAAVPPQPTAVPSAAAPQLPNLDASVPASETAAPKVRSNLDTPTLQKYNPAAPNAAISDKVYSKQDMRDSELREGGFKWMSWQSAGPKIQDFVKQQQPDLQSFIGDGQDTEVAITDLDADGQPDIVMYNLDDAQPNGYLFKIYFSNKSRTPMEFIGQSIRPFKKGVQVDEGYFSVY